MNPRLRRYALIMVAATVLALIACWQWVTWPTRTAHRFLELVEANRPGEWLQLLTPSCYAPEDNQKWPITNLTAHNRSLSDVVHARQAFAIIVSDPDGDLNVDFTVEGGKITSMEPDFLGRRRMQ